MNPSTQEIKISLQKKNFTPTEKNLAARDKLFALSVKRHTPREKGKKLAASSMLHEAKIAYYGFDVIRFSVPYAARLKLPGFYSFLRGRVAR